MTTFYPTRDGKPVQCNADAPEFCDPQELYERYGLTADPHNPKLATDDNGELHFRTPCPSWCSLEGRDIHLAATDSDHDRGPERFHGDLVFYRTNGTVWGHASEFADNPGVLEYAVGIGADGDSLTFTDASELRAFGAWVLAAARWLEDNQEAGK